MNGTAPTGLAYLCQADGGFALFCAGRRLFMPRHWFRTATCRSIRIPAEMDLGRRLGWQRAAMPKSARVACVYQWQLRPDDMIAFVEVPATELAPMRKGA